jgi:hypothetical protein
MKSQKANQTFSIRNINKKLLIYNKELIVDAHAEKMHRGI